MKLLPILLVMGALAAVLATPTALAQVRAQVTISDPQPTSMALLSNETDTISWTFTNTGQAQANVAYTLGDVTGWVKQTPSRSSPFVVPGQAQGQNSVTLSVEIGPVHTSDTFPANGTLTLSWSYDDAVGAVGSQQTSGVPLTYVAPVIPPPPEPEAEPEENPWPLILLGVLVAAALLALGWYYWQATVVKLDTRTPIKRINAGNDTVYQIEVNNAAGQPRTAQLRVREMPEGWTAAFSFPSVSLQPRESSSVPLYVKVPLGSPKGALGRIRVQARPKTYSPWLAKLDVAVQVDDVGGGRLPDLEPAPPPSVTPVRREWAGDVEKIIDVEGIGPHYADKLKAARIEDTRQLLEADSTEVAKKTGILVAFVRSWQAMCDLIRISGIGKQYSELLVRSGVRSVDQLAKETPQALLKRIEAYTARVEYAPTKGTVTKDMAKGWIARAKEIGGWPPPRRA